MYSYPETYSTLQNSFTPQYFPWSNQYFFLPLIQNPLPMSVHNSFHYQTQKHLVNIPNQLNPQIESQSGRKDPLYCQRSSDDSFDGHDEEKLTKKRKYYGTKNTEANIINQTFSFMNSSSKSQKVLQKLVKDNPQKITAFYTMMKIVKGNLKKYVNRSYLKSLFSMNRSNPTYKLLSKGKRRLQILSIEQFTELFRKMVWHYFTNQMVNHILSSSRLSRNTIGEHLKRRREIMTDIFEYAQSGQQSQ